MTRIRTLSASAALAALLCSGTAQAAPGSLAYVKDGDVQLAAPDGAHAVRLTTGGGYAWPSQADDGTLVAVRQTAEGGRTPRRLHRLGRDGAPLGAPVETVPVDNSFYIGPLAPAVSPDGRFVAYHYFYTGPITDDPAPRIAISHSDRDTPNGEITSTLGGYFTPSWTQDGRLLAFYAKERTYHADLWNPDDSVTNWFGDPDVATLLTDGELSRGGDRLVAVGDQNDLRFYELAAPAPAAPVLRCVLTGFNGDVSDPTWAPDGSALAWEEADGVHVASLPDLGACGSAARPLVVAGGQDPDWGPAAAPSAPAGDGGPLPDAGDGPGSSRLQLELSGWRRTVKARGRIRGTARCSAACSLTATLTVGARTARKLALGRKRARLARATRPSAAGPATLTLRLPKRTARKVRRADARLTVVATAAGGARATATRRVRLVR
jgi:hypothetical protein